MKPPLSKNELLRCLAVVNPTFLEAMQKIQNIDWEQKNEPQNRRDEGTDLLYP